MPINTATHYYAGPAVVYWDPRDPATGNLSGTPLEVGVNREAIPVIIQPKYLDVPSDDWGGPDGNPSDAQFMGAMAIIQLSLTKVNVAIADQLLDGLAYQGKVTGQFPQFGEFIRNFFTGQLTLDGTQLSARSDRKSMVFNRAFVRNGGAVGQGTRYSSYDFAIETWIDESVNTRQLYTLSYS